jgi:hypothetical protein
MKSSPSSPFQSSGDPTTRRLQTTVYCCAYVGIVESTQNNKQKHNSIVRMSRKSHISILIFSFLHSALGFLVGSLGPTILLLAQNVGQTRDGIGFLFSARGSGWVAGMFLFTRTL